MTAGLMKKSSEDRWSQIAAAAIRIRDAAESDLPTIVEIHNAAIASRISTAQLDPIAVEGRRECFRAHSPTQYPLWVAEFDRHYRRLAQLSRISPALRLSRYGRDQPLRRRKISTPRRWQKIVAGSDRGRPAAGMHSLVGLIFGHNEPSIALFPVAGFECWGLLPGVARVDQTPRDLTIFGRHI